MIIVRDATIHRTNGCTLGFFMESHTFGTFIRDNIINLVTYRLLNSVGIHLHSIG
jgi:hypothetical protein